MSLGLIFIVSSSAAKPRPLRQSSRPFCLLPFFVWHNIGVRVSFWRTIDLVFFFFIKSQSETMDLKQQMTGTLGRNQIVFSSVSFFYAGTNPSSPAPLGLQQSMSRSSRSVTVFSLSLSYSMRHHGNSGVGPVPNLSQLWKFRQENGSHENGHLCVKKGGEKKDNLVKISARL